MSQAERRELAAMLAELEASHPDQAQVEQYRAGKKTMAAYFVGQVMKASRGQAKPALVNEILVKKLEA